METGNEKVSAALVKAQHEVKLAQKDSANPFYKSKYTSLLSVWEACRDALKNNDLAVVQYGISTTNSWALITRIIHASGQSIEGSLPLICAKQNDPQAFGSAITYSRRYGLAAMLGVCPDDDDGEAAMQRPQSFRQNVAENKKKIEEWNKLPQEEKNRRMHEVIDTDAIED